jgi:hypothetical protein
MVSLSTCSLRKVCRYERLLFLMHVRQDPPGVKHMLVSLFQKNVPCSHGPTPVRTVHDNLCLFVFDHVLGCNLQQGTIKGGAGCVHPFLVGKDELTSRGDFGFAAGVEPNGGWVFGVREHFILAANTKGFFPEVVGHFHD